MQSRVTRRFCIDGVTIDSRMAAALIFHIIVIVSFPISSCTEVRRPSPNKTDIRAAILLPGNNQRLFSIQKVILAIQYAFISEQVRNLLPNCKFTLYNGDSKCNSIAAPIEAFNMLHVDKVHVIFGPVCDYSLGPVARYAPFWDTPVISPGGMAHDFGDGSEYPLLTRIGFKFRELAQLIKAIVQHYKWNNIKILYSADGHSEISNRFCYLAMSALEKQFDRDNIEYDKFSFEHDEEIDDIDKVLLEEVGVDYAIIVLCTSPDSVRNVMIRANELNFDNGDYVFLNIDLFSSEERLRRPWYRADSSPKRNQKARRAYEVMLTFSLKHPETAAYLKFSEALRNRSLTVYKQQVYGNDDEVNTFVGCFYDAVLLFAMGLNRTLQVGLPPTNGTHISRSMWNQSFEGITGTVNIDEHGDRQFEYTVQDMDPATGLFGVVATYHGGMQKYLPVRGRDINWGGGRKVPPLSKPECGYNNSQCQSKSFPTYVIAIVILSAMVISVTLAAVFLHRHYKREAMLAEINWRIRWEDIMVGFAERRKLEKSRDYQRSRSRSRLNSLSTNVSSETLDMLQQYQPKHIKTAPVSTLVKYQQLHSMARVVCHNLEEHVLLRSLVHCLRDQITALTYKGSIVAIKKFNRPGNITRPMLVEIVQMRNLHHEHIVRFIGVCIDAPNQCLVMEHCAKGSLQSILECSDMKLDIILKLSMIQDIVRGLVYLHASEIHSHGNLTSSNCVIDSRFVVKITNFGLHSFRTRRCLKEDGSYRYYRGMLWTAPELLRLDDSRPPGGTQKGDVYSFGIICQEIVYRRGPFWIENKNYMPQDIYQLVRSGVNPNNLTRPTLSAVPLSDEEDGCGEDLFNIITRCWAEDPADRPELQSLTVKRTEKSDTNDNLLDNLLSRMEQYAQNLEALVEERTTDYLEQKHHAEDLLYMMLPRYVAVQLMMGMTVDAEKFECVTVAFSDICGFTALSADSKPMQVVDMLNDLYTLFDSILDMFDVYKVETIGDAYMVASGLPVRNGIMHAHEIARMSLALIRVVQSFTIRHRPHDQLKLRIGIHTGPVCAGVVGVMMPRYCLFGDTVNTASRLESHSEPLKIHVSSQTKEILDLFGVFLLEARGQVSIKGKGDMATWWLLGEIDVDSPDTVTEADVSQNDDVSYSEQPNVRNFLLDVC